MFWTRQTDETGEGENEPSEPMDVGEVEIDQQIVHPDLPKPWQHTSSMTITYGFMKDQWNKESLQVRRRNPDNQFVKSVFIASGLPMIMYPTDDPQVNERYDAAVNYVRKRFVKRLDKAKKASSDAKAGLDMNEVVFFLEDEPFLVDWDSELFNDDIVPPPAEYGTQEAYNPFEFDLDEPSTSKRRKSLDECTTTYIRDQMQELFDKSLEKSHEWKISPIQAFCFMAARYAHQLPDRALEETFRQIAKGNCRIPAELSMDEAVFLKSSWIKTQRNWKEFRLFLKDKIKLPTDEEISKYTDSLTPKFIKFQNGYRINLVDAIKYRMERLPDDVSSILMFFIHLLNLNPTLLQVMQKMDKSEGDGNVFETEVSFGLDGCGSHSRYNGQDGIDTGNLIFSGFSFIRMTKNGKDVHTQENMASADNCSPLYLIDGKETRELLRSMMNIMEEEGKYFEKHPIFLEYNGKTFEVWVKLALTQLDGKCKKLLQGRGSAFCLLCSTSRKDAHDIQKIKEGFPMDINTKDLNERFNTIKAAMESETDPEKEQVGEYRLDTVQFSFEERLQLIHKPCVQHFQVSNCLPPLHCRMRSFAFISDIMKRFDAQKLTYYKKVDPDIEKKFKEVKEGYVDRSRTVFGKLMWAPSPDGGTTDNGNTARMFFSYEKRQNVLDLMEDILQPAEGADAKEYEEYWRKVEEKEEFQDVLRILLQNLGTILNILNSDELVRIERFADLCTSTAVLVAEKLPWVQFSPTVHAILAHAPQVIHDNGNRGLLGFSEEGSEANHKLIKNLREKEARKMSLDRNLWDVLKKLWIRTDLRFRQFKRVLVCSHCHAKGHSVRGCPLKTQKPKNEDDLLFDSLIYTD